MTKKTLITSGNRKIHYRKPGVKNRRLALACGRLYTPYMLGLHGGSDATEVKSKVTCQKCLKMLGKKRK